MGVSVLASLCPNHQGKDVQEDNTQGCPRWVWAGRLGLEEVLSGWAF